ncbi:hypothetical protein L596_003042 [Steinernema carpocapsae]|uniref:Uncharacterized protein n=1 Tax=Steinernema carpocapsae TaxID=34508 RepID=A0A4U8UU52_STECR|nr:hypothetical protein L596_003042 [Steinernema carpocapsae]
MITTTNRVLQNQSIPKKTFSFFRVGVDFCLKIAACVRVTFLRSATLLTTAKVDDPTDPEHEITDGEETKRKVPTAINSVVTKKDAEAVVMEDGTTEKKEIENGVTEKKEDEDGVTDIATVTGSPTKGKESSSGNSGKPNGADAIAAPTAAHSEPGSDLPESTPTETKIDLATGVTQLPTSKSSFSSGALRARESTFKITERALDMSEIWYLMTTALSGNATNTSTTSELLDAPASVMTPTPSPFKNVTDGANEFLPTKSLSHDPTTTAPNMAFYSSSPFWTTSSTQKPALTEKPGVEAGGDGTTMTTSPKPVLSTSNVIVITKPGSGVENTTTTTTSSAESSTFKANGGSGAVVVPPLVSKTPDQAISSSTPKATGSTSKLSSSPPSTTTTTTTSSAPSKN